MRQENRALWLWVTADTFFLQYASFRIDNIYFLREDKFSLRNVTFAEIFTQS